MKLVKNKYSLPYGSETRGFYFTSIIAKTLFLGALCFELTATASRGEVPKSPNHGNSFPHGVYSKLHEIRNVKTPTITTLKDEDEDESFGYDPNHWPMYNYNALGTRYNTVERKLSSKTVQQLKVKWTFITEGNVNATPIVVEDKVYAGDTSGNFYALSQTGQLLWKTKVNGSVTASALVTPNRIIFGDLAGYIYGLNRQTGKIIWTIRPNQYQNAQVWSSPTLVGRYAVIGIASDRGSAVLLDPNNGAIIWQTYTISPEEASRGSKGAPIWSTPTYDATTGTIYVTTGDNYTLPVTTTSDAFIALNARTGSIIWQHQLVANDGGDNNPDVDFGDSPQIYRLTNGEKVVGAGSKNGVYYVLDAATGASVNQYTAEPQCKPPLSLFADSAVAEGVVYANGNNCLPQGELIAIIGDGSGEKWRFTSTEGSAALSGVAVANGVVYFQVINANGGFLYALNAKDGTKLVEIPISIAASGPAVVDGQVYLGTGLTNPPFIFTQGGSIIAFGL